MYVYREGVFPEEWGSMRTQGRSGVLTMVEAALTQVGPAFTKVKATLTKVNVAITKVKGTLTKVNAALTKVKGTLKGWQLPRLKGR
jgi:hypothetical protein